MTERLSLPGLTDKVIVVTGAARGQGLAETEILVDSGATVIAADLADEVSDGLASVMARHPDRVHYRRLDVSNEADWTQLAHEVTSRWGRVDGLVNNAGIAFRSRIGDIVREDWDRVLSINLTGAMLGIQALVPLMCTGSSIVNIGSSAGLNAHHTVAYTASKWGLRGLTHVTATEFGPRGIRTNIVHPGYVATELVAAAPPAFVDAQLALTPLERLGEPRDIAGIVAFLLSDAASYINGAEIPVDGGFTSSAGVKYMSDTIKKSQA